MVFWYIGVTNITGMKKGLLILCVLGMASAFAGVKLPSKKADPAKSAGCGYRIIEFGVGINCNGDTVRLEHAKGFQHLTTSVKKDSKAAV